MANPEHLKILKQEVDDWNKWRQNNPDVRPDLSGADLTNAFLIEANLCEADLSSACLYGAITSLASFRNANLQNADLQDVVMLSVDLRGADLRFAHMAGTQFIQSNLSYANLSNSWMCGVSFLNSDLTRAKIINSKIYGISAWDIKKDGLIQKELIITPDGEPEITVDDLEVAQFIYLLLNNQKIRDVIETITSKAVLILGRFTPERKAVLDAIKDELRLRNYLPIVFDFENASNKSVDETVNLLARMSRFVIADITDARSIPQELRGIVPDNPSVPIVPLIWKEQREYGMFDHFRNYPWVLPVHEYESSEQLMANIITAIIAPAEQKVLELKKK